MEKVLCYRDDDVDDDGVSGITFNEKLFDLYFNLKWSHPDMEHILDSKLCMFCT